MIGFVVPDLAGRPSGGTRYDARLITELRRLGIALADAAPEAIASLDAAELVVVDSLYLDVVPDFRRARRGACLGVLLHYLPSLVERGVDPIALSEIERAALDAADLLVVPSEYLRGVVERAGYVGRPIVVVEPGCDVALGARPPPSERVRALLVGHVVPGKGIAPLLDALGRARLEDAFSLRIVGDPAADPEYADRCRVAVARSPGLERSVEFVGSIDATRVASELARADLFVSASRMESYGMALAEARCAGVPIVACAGGNVAAHVSADWGGELVDDPPALAAACARLARNPGELQRRIARARATAPTPRAWSRAARELVAGLARHGVSVDRRNEGTNARTTA